MTKEMQEYLEKEFLRSTQDLSVKKDIVLEVKHLKMYFPITVGLFKTKMLKAVDDVSFSIKRGETVGLVGESGCGKTTLGRTILQLYNPTGGQIVFNGQRVNPGTKIDYEEVNGKKQEVVALVKDLEEKIKDAKEKGENTEELESQLALANSRIERLDRALLKITRGKNPNEEKE